MAQTDRQRERIAGNTSWTFVWQNARKCGSGPSPLTASLDNSTNQSGWAITDGSAGLRGEIIKSDNLADIKLFAATFLSGAASSLTEKQPDRLWPHQQPYAQQRAVCRSAVGAANLRPTNFWIRSQKNGFYVRVPSGKQFYLYVLQTLDRADATFGGTGLVEEKDEQPATTPKR